MTHIHLCYFYPIKWILWVSAVLILVGCNSPAREEFSSGHLGMGLGDCSNMIPRIMLPSGGGFPDLSEVNTVSRECREPCRCLYRKWKLEMASNHSFYFPGWEINKIFIWRLALSSGKRNPPFPRKQHNPWDLHPQILRKTLRTTAYSLNFHKTFEDTIEFRCTLLVALHLPLSLVRKSPLSRVKVELEPHKGQQV